jgi:enoyl-CoA hydratase/carnithine racemase
MASLVRERIDDGIEVVRLDRPERRNAMDTALLAELNAALEELAGDEALTALVFSTTSERALCSGADVSETLDDDGAVARMEAFTRMYSALEAFPAPTIAVCVGDCIGAGAELVSGSDLRVGGDNLRLGWPGARLGVPVGPARLTPLVGLARAKELIFTGRLIGVEEASTLGLLHAHGPADGAEAAALDLARTVSAHPGEGLRRLKAMFRDLEGTEHRASYENDRLLEFERRGPGLPRTRP